ncbi:lipopolysaccharide biosynthesis protein [Vibrio sonorensis]|uniref:lipopolysaccharide biosynthesis protein n=1 Tax=Vibrio sonorensis TaxID=1004316 RepID=UPI0008D9A2A4|nr:lipopolysaccharide biosynthesis protein [Vibrio sonorensis]
MVVLSKAMQDMAIYGASLLFTKGFALITLPIMTYFLSAQQIGRLDLIATSAALMSLLVGVALHESLYRYIAKFKRFDDQKRLVSVVFTLSFTISMLASGLWMVSLSAGLLENPWIDTKQLFLIGLIVAFEGPLTICTAWIRIQNRAVLFFKMSMILLVSQFVLLIAVLIYIPSETSVLSIGVLCTSFQFIFLWHYLDIPLTVPRVRRITALLKYAAPLMLSALVLFGLSGGERWIIGVNASLESLGHYAVAMKFAIATGVLMQPFGMWWMPKRFQYFNQFGNETVARYSQYGLVYLALLCVLVAWTAKAVISLFLDPQYQISIFYCIGAIAVVMLKESTEIVNFGILKSKQNHWILVNNLVWTTIGLSLCWVLIDYGVLALIFAIWLSQLGRLFSIYIKSQSLTPMPYKGHSCALLLSVSLLSILTIALDLDPISSVLFAFTQITAIVWLANKLELAPSLFSKVRLLRPLVGRYD